MKTETIEKNDLLSIDEKISFHTKNRKAHLQELLKECDSAPDLSFIDHYGSGGELMEALKEFNTSNGTELVHLNELLAVFVEHNTLGQKHAANVVSSVGRAINCLTAIIRATPTIEVMCDEYNTNCAEAALWDADKSEK